MPLPVAGNLIGPPTPGGITPAVFVVAPGTPAVVTDNVATFSAMNGSANWAGNTLNITAAVGNYWYVPQAAGGHAHYCVVPGGGGGDAYVVSDNYGGCEYHEAYHAVSNTLAFFHVFRGNGLIARYTLAAGWVLRNVIRSYNIAQTLGTNWSISCINRAVNPPVVQSAFIRVTGAMPPLTVGAVDPGLAQYPAVERFTRWVWGG